MHVDTHIYVCTYIQYMYVCASTLCAFQKDWTDDLREKKSIHSLVRHCTYWADSQYIIILDGARGQQSHARGEQRNMTDACLD